MATHKSTNNKLINDSNIIFIGNIPYNSNEDAIGSHFEIFGHIKEVRIAKNPDDTLREFCYVEFHDSNSATKALQYDGTLFDGKIIKVDLAEKINTIQNKMMSGYKWSLEI